MNVAELGMLGRHKLRAGLVSIVFTGALVWVLSRGGFPLLPSAAALSSLDPALFALFCGLLLFNLLTRFARCHFLIAPLAKVPLARLMAINAVGMALITYLPLRLGELSRPALLRERGSLSAWAVTGTVGAERILDGLVLSSMLLIGLALASPQVPLPDHVGSLPVPVWVVPHSARLAATLFVGAFLVMLALYRFRAAARRSIERAVGLVSVELGRRVADIVERVCEGLSFLTNKRYALPYLLVTLLSVTSLILAIQVLAHAVGLPELTFTRSMVVLGVLALGFAVPNTPGFFGMVQLALYAGLATYIAPEKVASEGAVMVFVYYVTYLGCVSGLASLGLLSMLSWSRKRGITASEGTRPA